MKFLFNMSFWIIAFIVFLLILFSAPLVAIAIVGGILIYSVAIAILATKIDEKEQKRRDK